MSSAQQNLVEHLYFDGPVNISPAHRRVRAVLNGQYVLDTNEALHVWEHPSFPQFYVPYGHFKTGGEAGGRVSVEAGKEIKIEGDTLATALRVTVGDRTSKGAIHLLPNVEKFGALKGLVRVTFQDFDQFYEEDEPVYVHPKDPTKRLTLLPSSRSIEVQIDGHVVAKTTHSVHLIEPLLPVRYYLTPAAVDPALLRVSNLRSLCPYKGEAEYYDVYVGGKTYRDIIWWYRHPTSESQQIAGLLCFYNEKVDVWVDGVKQKRPKSKFG